MKKFLTSKQKDNIIYYIFRKFNIFINSIRG